MDMYDPIGNDNTRVPKSFIPLVCIAQVCGLLMVVLTAIWAGHFWQGFDWSHNTRIFNFHPLFMIMGLVFLYGDSILVYRVFRTYPKLRVKWLHAVIHILALLFAVIGLVAVFNMHNRNKIPNLYSLHSWIGLIVVVLFALQWMSAFITFLMPQLSQPIRAALLPLHVSAGLFLFTGAIVAVISGITEKNFFADRPAYKDLAPREMMGNFIGLMTMIFGALIFYLVTSQSFRRVEPAASPSEQTVVSTHPYATGAAAHTKAP